MMGTEELPSLIAISCTVLMNSIHWVTFQPLSRLPWRSRREEIEYGLLEVNEIQKICNCEARVVPGQWKLVQFGIKI